MASTREFDVIVIGAGPAGEHCAGASWKPASGCDRPAWAGRGASAACIPSKTLLRPGEALQAAREAPGAREAVSGGVRTEGAFEWRDFMVATYTRAYAERPGFMTLLSDGEWRTGAYALGPEAGEWLQQATVGIGGRVPLSVLFDVIQPFPTFSEAFLSTPSELEAKTTTQGLSTPPITT